MYFFLVFDERGKELHKLEQHVFGLVIERRMMCVRVCSFLCFYEIEWSIARKGGGDGRHYQIGVG